MPSNSTGISGSTDAESITTDPACNIYIGGVTNSKDTTLMSTPGTFQRTLSGNLDGYLAKFSQTGQRLWGTYFGSTNIDYVLAIAFDRKRSLLYSAGQCYYSPGLATQGAHQTNCNGTSGHLSSFTAEGKRLWTTYFGPNQTGISGICVDTFNAVYIAGTTNSTDSIATHEAYDTTNRGNGDAFISRFIDPIVKRPVPDTLFCTGQFFFVAIYRCRRLSGWERTQCTAFRYGRVISVEHHAHRCSRCYFFQLRQYFMQYSCFPHTRISLQASHYRLPTHTMHRWIMAFPITINASIPLSVSIAASAGLQIVSGQPDTFRALVANATGPLTYQWSKNLNVIPGATDSIFASGTLQNNDFISVIVNTTGNCRLQGTDAATIHVNALGITRSSLPFLIWQYSRILSIMAGLPS